MKTVRKMKSYDDIEEWKDEEWDLHWGGIWVSTKLQAVGNKEKKRMRKLSPCQLEVLQCLIAAKGQTVSYSVLVEIVRRYPGPDDEKSAGARNFVFWNCLGFIQMKLNSIGMGRRKIIEGWGISGNDVTGKSECGKKRGGKALHTKTHRRMQSKVSGDSCIYPKQDE